MTTNNGRRAIALASGGTGGHLFPAQALGEELVRRGYDIHLLTDERVRDYGNVFPAVEIHEIPAATITPSSPLKVPGQLMKLFSGYRRAVSSLLRVCPKAVVGFGGYPSLPPLLAARKLGIPAIVHEQNAVMGRANRLLSRWTVKIASSFPHIHGLEEEQGKKVVFTGNPVRDVVLKHVGAPFKAPQAEETFNLLVFGGSQGARFFSDMMPGAIAALPKAVRRQLRVVQQCRPEDLDRVKAAYKQAGVKAELAAFFSDLPAKMAASHLVIGRAGASTVAELGVIGRPAVLVPLPHALDNDQLRNAQSFADAGGGWVHVQSEFSEASFGAFFTRLRFQPGELEAAANSAQRFGKPDAAQRLADAVESLISPVPVGAEPEETRK